MGLAQELTETRKMASRPAVCVVPPLQMGGFAAFITQFGCNQAPHSGKPAYNSLFQVSFIAG